MTISRTTVRLEADLLRAARKLAAETGRTLTSLIEDGLREILARRKRAPDEADFDLPVYGRGDVHPGIDISNSADLQDRMEDFVPR